MAKSFLAKTGENKQKDAPPRRQLPWRKIGLIAGGILLAFLLGIGVFWLQNNIGQQAGKEDSKFTNELPPKGPIEESIILSLKGDYDGAQKYLEKELAKTPSKEQKHALLLQQSTNAYNAQKYEESLGYAQEAIKVSDNYLVNKAAGEAAEASGQKSVAADYYRTALQRLSEEEDNTWSNADKQRTLDEAIARVSQ